MDERVATGMSEARSRSASWEENAHAREKAVRQPSRGSCRGSVRRSGIGRRENVRSPGHAVRSPRLRGASPPRKR
jgi:hypothetical protein